MKNRKILLALSLFITVLFLFTAAGCNLDADTSQDPGTPEETVKPEPDPGPEPEAESEAELEVIVNVDVLRLRSGPSTNHEILDRLMLGTLLPVIGQEGEWFQVITPKGTDGWVHGDYVKIKDQTTGTDGGISGSLSYPSSYIPGLRVAAFNIDNDSVYYVDTAEGQLHYQIDGLSPGNYYVVAYTDSGYAGGYSQLVLDGLQYGFDDHTLLPVSVYAGKITEGIDPADWYAPEDAFPPRP